MSRSLSDPVVSEFNAGINVGEDAGQLFGLLLQSSPTFGLLTGTLAGVLAFLFWIYTGLAIVLLGAQFAAVLNGDRRTDTPA